MAIGRTIIRVILEVLWPWFRDNVWPVIREEVVALLRQLFQDIRQWVEEWLSRQARREDEARASAEVAREAEKQAAASGNFAEAEAQRRIAEVWKQVADSFREENEILKKQLKDLMSRGDDAMKQVREMKLRTSADHPSFTIGGRELPLPPPSSGSVRCPHCGAEI
jgi:hypothetical protein